jgi:hypothetical protein
MRATNLVLGAIIAGALLGTAACGGGTVTIRPADGSTVPTSGTTITGRSSAGITVGPSDSPAAGYTIGADGRVTAGDGSGAGFTIGADGSVTAGDGNGAGYTIGPDGTITASDGAGNGFTAGPGGVTARAADAGSVQTGLGAGASDVVAFCGQASRYFTANLAMAKALRATDSGDADRFTTALATTADAVARMRPVGPPAIQPDLQTLDATAREFAAALQRSDGDLRRLAADGSLDGISAAGQTSYERLASATAEACG